MQSLGQALVCKLGLWSDGRQGMTLPFVPPPRDLAVKLHRTSSFFPAICASLLISSPSDTSAWVGTAAQQSPASSPSAAGDTVVFDEVVQVASQGSRNLNVWLHFEDVAEGRHQQEIAEIRSRIYDAKRFERVTLYRVVGVTETDPPEEVIRTPEQRDGHVTPFRWPPGDFRFRVVVTSDGPDKITYVPGQWAYLSAKPRELLRKRARIPMEEVALKQLTPTVAGMAAFEAPILLLRDLAVDRRYRVQVIKLGHAPLPEGISLRVRVARPQVAK